MKRKGHITFIAGFLAGAVLFGGATAFAASGIMANLTTGKVFVNGKEIKAEAYNIHNNNFFMLRDIAAAVDFSVVWDGANDRVLIDTSRGYDWSEQPPQTAAPPTPTPATGGYGYTFSPLKTGDVVKTAPVETSKGSVGGDYKILQGMEDKPWKTSDGTVWPNVPLPAWQSEWDAYPGVTFPDQPPVRFTGDVRGVPYDTLMVFNSYEVERMVRTIYKYARQNPSLWKDHDPSANIPNFTISIEIADDMGYNTFYPWRDWEVEKQVTSTGGGTVFRIYAYDSYNNGKFSDTEYFMK
jgi:hypothetical protein